MAWNWPRARAEARDIPAASAAPEDRPVHRSTLDITPTFSATGPEAVADAASAIARCADPATCRSEFETDSLTSQTVTCTRCGLQGVLDAECIAALVPGDVIELPAGKDASRG